MKALFLFADVPGREAANSSAVRVLMPGKYLARAGHGIEISFFGDTDWANVPPVVMLERVITPELVEKLRMAGAGRIVCTFDDNYGMMPAMSPSRFYWHGVEDDWDKSFKAFQKALSLVDLSIVPNRLLISDFSVSARGRIRYIPNYLDPELWEGLPERHNDKVVIGWGGSLQHNETWRRSKLLPALKVVAKEYGDKVEIVSCGVTADEFFEFYDIPFRRQPWTKFDAWPRVVGSFDIGLAPLIGKYDERRSNLKLLEYGAARVPYVASYLGDYVTDGSPGGVFAESNTVEAWLNALRPLIEDEGARRYLGNLGWDWAQGYLMPDHVKDYEAVLWPDSGDQASDSSPA
jgi:hypothetical protein